MAACDMRRSASTLSRIFGLQQVAAPPVLRDALDVEFEPEPEPEPDFSPSRRRGLFWGPVRVGVASPPIGPSAVATAGSGADILAACELYNGLCKVLPALKIELLAALCFTLKSPSLIVELWQRIDSDGGAHKHKLLCNAADLSSEPLR